MPYALCIKGKRRACGCPRQSGRRATLLNRFVAQGLEVPQAAADIAPVVSLDQPKNRRSRDGPTDLLLQRGVHFGNLDDALLVVLMPSLNEQSFFLETQDRVSPSSAPLPAHHGRRVACLAEISPQSEHPVAIDPQQLCRRRHRHTSQRGQQHRLPLAQLLYGGCGLNQVQRCRQFDIAMKRPSSLTHFHYLVQFQRCLEVR